MKYDEIINEVKSLYPSEYDESRIFEWIKELEATISVYCEKEPEEITAPDGETIVSAPFDRMYLDFVMAHISLHQHDDEGYMRYITLFNSRYCEWQNSYMSTHRGPEYQHRNWI